MAYKDLTNGFAFVPPDVAAESWRGLLQIHKTETAAWRERFYVQARAVRGWPNRKAANPGQRTNSIAQGEGSAATETASAARQWPLT
jgi:hypothetical protein